MAIFPTLCVEKFNITGGFGRLERCRDPLSWVEGWQGLRMGRNHRAGPGRDANGLAGRIASGCSMALENAYMS
jgi:hypothetical protein